MIVIYIVVGIFAYLTAWFILLCGTVYGIVKALVTCIVALITQNVKVLRNEIKQEGIKE